MPPKGRDFPLANRDCAVDPGGTAVLDWQKQDQLLGAGTGSAAVTQPANSPMTGAGDSGRRAAKTGWQQPA